MPAGSRDMPEPDTTRSSSPRDYRDKESELIDTFIRQRSNILGIASLRWQDVVEKSPELADGEHPLALAKIIEVALVRLSLWMAFLLDRGRYIPKQCLGLNENGRGRQRPVGRIQ